MRPTTLREQGDPTVAARQRANIPRKRAMTIRALKLGVNVVTGADIEYDDKRDVLLVLNNGKMAVNRLNP
jgi:hypothetical protein